MERSPARATSNGLAVEAVQGSRFSVIPRSTLPEEVANRLLTLIKEQELRPGAKLPAERNLARMMEVGRPAVREALRALALMRVVDIRQGDGTYITSLEPSQLIAHLDFVFPKDSVALVQLLEARRVVEAGNARLAASRVTASQIAALGELVEQLAGSIDDLDRFSELDIALHEAICAAANNFLLSQFMSIVSALGKVSRERTGGLREVREAALRDHRRIVDALRTHDPDAAAQAMLDHLAHVERGLNPPPDQVGTPEAEADTEPEAARVAQAVGGATAARAAGEVAPAGGWPR